MIQRKQTIWLFIAGMIAIATCYFPYGIEQTSPMDTNLITDKSLSAKNNTILFIISASISIISFITIFLFKNRNLQKNICWLLILLCVGTAGYMLYDTQLSNQNHKLVIGLLGQQFYFGMLVPIISLCFIALAIVGIKSDEKLIKSMDRLR